MPKTNQRRKPLAENRSVKEAGSAASRSGEAAALLGDVDAATAAALVSGASDVALIVDGAGIIREVVCDNDDLAQEGFDKWVGQAWADTVSIDSRPKVEALLDGAAARGARKWRHVNHTSFRGADVPILYSTVRTGADGRVVAFGRDLRPLAQLQQRLMDAQHSMERDYWRLRNVELRYRLLFQQVGEAVLVVEAATGRVSEANPAAETVLGDTAKRIVGRTVPEYFDGDGSKAVQAHLGAVMAVGHAGSIRARLAGTRAEVEVAASLFHQDNASWLLVRVAPGATAGGMASVSPALMKVLENAPDGFVVTDLDARILTANAAFAELAQSPSLERLVGLSLDRWLGRTGVECNVLVTNLRQHGSVRLFSTVLNGEHGSTTDVEVSAVAVTSGDLPCLGFTIRNVGRRLASETRTANELPRSVQQLTELVGRVPMKDIVGETAELIEKLCIQAALELTRDNRASAAEMLGLSRQSLYIKLRRYGIGDLGAGEDA